MSTIENLTPSDENSAEQAITIQPSGITAYPGSGDWMQSGGNDAAQGASGAFALLHAVRRHWLVILSSGLACAAVVGCLVLFVFYPPAYKAEAYLKLEPAMPTILAKPTAEQSQQIQNEFEIFRSNQQDLIKNPYVIQAALRDPKLKNRKCISVQDDNHNAIGWLTNEIRVDMSKIGGIMSPDRVLLRS